MGTGKEEEGRSKRKSNRPTITPPARGGGGGGLFSMESPFGCGGLSPGPMTLVSRFFSDDSNNQSFSQLLAGAMNSPLARPLPPLLADGNGFEDVGVGGFKESRPANLVVARSPLFTVPPGLSPSGLLNSPAFFSPPSPFGISHQQALAQVTAQAALVQSQMHMQPEYQPSTMSAAAESMASHQSFTKDELQQQMAPSNSDPQSSLMERAEVSHSDGKHLQPSLAADKPANDGYNWRKYGQKPIKGSEYPRSYYKCTHLRCLVKKKVERSSEGQISQIIYKNEHNHEKPHPNRRAKDGADVNGNMNSLANPELGFQGPAGNFSNQASETVPTHSVMGSNQEYNRAAHIYLPDSSDSEEQGIADNRKEGDDDEPNLKRRNVGESEVSLSHKTVTEPKIIVQTRSEVDLLDDGYRWRKYGQKVVKGNPHPRSYYKCTHVGCNVRKHVERAPTDPKAVITTYEGKHNHDVPAARSSSHNAANNSAPQLKSNSLVTDNHSLLKDRSVLQQLKKEPIVV